MEGQDGGGCSQERIWVRSCPLLCWWKVGRMKTSYLEVGLMRGNHSEIPISMCRFSPVTANSFTLLKGNIGFNIMLCLLVSIFTGALLSS